jgi:hypothetical protein
MGRIVKLTERDLTKLVKRVIREMDDDYENEYTNKSLDELLEIAKRFMLDELEFSKDAIDEMDEWYIVDVLRDYSYDELASEIEEKLYDEADYQDFENF